MAIAIEFISVNSTKYISHIQRPDLGDHHAFPSGHTATAFMCAEFLRQEYKDVSPWIPAVGYAAATATGVLRVYNNKHWISDVIAGAGFGVLSTECAYFIRDKMRQKHLRKKMHRAE
jgi:membrane-associated phospholipid phosphatase